MRRVIIPGLLIFGLLILATIGILISRPKTSPPTSSTPPINRGEVAQAQLAQLMVNANQPYVGSDLLFDLSLKGFSTDLSAISISLKLPYTSASAPLTVDQEPFTLSPEMIDAGWQVLLNQASFNQENNLVVLELAIGTLGSPQADLDFTNFAQVQLGTNQIIENGQIMIDAITTKVVSSQGETLPVQLLTQPYQVVAQSES